MRAVRIVDGEVVTATAPSARELDVLIAEQVMGFRRPPTFLAAYPRHYTDPAMPEHHQETPYYSTSIVAAWTVHLAMCARLFSTRVRYLDALREESRTPEGWLPDGLHALVVLRHRFPASICRAALAACSGTDSRPDTLAAVREAETECHAEVDDGR